MEDFLSIILVDGDLIQTFVRLFILVFSFDCLIGIANAIKSLKGVSS